MRGEWTEGELKDVITNIIYVGIPPFPQLIEEEQWVRAAEKAIKEEGHDEFFYRLIRNLKAAYGKVLEEIDKEYKKKQK